MVVLALVGPTRNRCLRSTLQATGTSGPKHAAPARRHRGEIYLSSCLLQPRIGCNEQQQRLALVDAQERFEMHCRVRRTLKRARPKVPSDAQQVFLSNFDYFDSWFMNPWVYNTENTLATRMQGLLQGRVAPGGAMQPATSSVIDGTSTQPVQ